MLCIYSECLPSNLSFRFLLPFSLAVFFPTFPLLCYNIMYVFCWLPGALLYLQYKSRCMKLKQVLMQKNLHKRIVPFILGIGVDSFPVLDGRYH